MKIDKACRVTIIMSVYNEEKTIERALESIIAQTFKKWKLLICDDGSSDDTVKIINRYTKLFPSKIILIRNRTNRGLTYSLNRMVKICKTEYIARMDADDISHKDRLEKEVEFLDSNHIFAFVGSSINKFDDNGLKWYVEYPEFPTKKMLVKCNPFVHPSIIIRTNILGKVNAYRNSITTARCEDYDLWFRLYERGYCGYNFREPLVDYYEGSLAFAKRKLKYRISEMCTRAVGYKRNDLYPMAFPYVFKPLIAGMVPKKVVIWYKKRQRILGDSL